MKKLLTTLALLFLLTNIKAQEELKSIVERINNCPYIFEGKVIFSKSYENTDKNIIYTTSTIEITKVLKGDLECGKVEVITCGGEVNEKISQNSHLLTLKEGYAGIFLCGKNKRALPLTDYIVEENTEKLYPIFEKQSFIKYYYEGLKMVASDVTFNYDSIAKVYDLVNLVSQINYIDCNNSNSIIYNNHQQNQ